MLTISFLYFFVFLKNDPQILVLDPRLVKELSDDYSFI